MKHFFVLIEELILSKLLTRHFKRGKPLPGMVKQEKYIRALKLIPCHCEEIAMRGSVPPCYECKQKHEIIMS